MNNQEKECCFWCCSKSFFFAFYMQFDQSTHIQKLCMKQNSIKQADPHDKPREVKGKKGSTIMGNQARQEKLQEIDALYRSQIKKLYTESKSKVETNLKKDKSDHALDNGNKMLVATRTDSRDYLFKEPPQPEPADSSRSQYYAMDNKVDDEKIRASSILQGESTRTIEILRKENQNKEFKIRDLTYKCQSLLERLKEFLPPQEVEKELESLKEYSHKKMERIENLFKIKNEEIFFKIKLQIIGLLQEFDVPKEEIAGINEISTESTLLSFMSRKLKIKLKDFRYKEQESSIEIQKDKILNQKFQERIHYLMETNDLLKLSQTKLKQKVEDHKIAMNEFLDKFKSKQVELQERESEIFRLKQHNEELQSTIHKMQHLMKSQKGDTTDQTRLFEAKEKEMKALLSSYFMEKKRLEGDLEEKQSNLEEMYIKQKFLEQENQRINREFVRWKERFQWLEKEKQNRQRQSEEDKTQLQEEFEAYKVDNNQGLLLNYQTELDEAVRKIEETQQLNQKLTLDIEQEHKLANLKQQQIKKQIEVLEHDCIEKVKMVQKLKEQQLQELMNDSQNRLRQLREEFQKKESLLGEEMEARMKALLAERDKKATQKFIELQNDNEDLKRENDNLHRLLEMKDSLIGLASKENTKEMP